MVLAAGRGERMRPLTLHTPKPLLEVGGRALIDYHLERLARAGIRELVVNVSHLGAQIQSHCGDGSAYGLSIRWSPEPTPLETAGGILRALHWLGDAPFLVVNADIWMDYPVEVLCAAGPRLAPGAAHLMLVDNPPHHTAGDFWWHDQDGRIMSDVAARAGDAVPAGYRRLTYSGVGIYHPDFFAGEHPESLPLLPLLRRAIDNGLLHGSHFAGEWQDVGTPERLEALRARHT